MMRLQLAIAALAFASPSAVAAQSPPTIAGWQVGPQEGGCAMLRLVDKDGGPAAMVGLSTTGESQIAFFSPGSAIEPGYFYAGVIEWDDKVYPIHFVSGGSPEMPGVIVQSGDDRLVSAAERNQSVSIAVAGVTESMAFPLAGAKDAAEGLRQCVAQVKGK